MRCSKHLGGLITRKAGTEKNKLRESQSSQTGEHTTQKDGRQLERFGIFEWKTCMPSFLYSSLLACLPCILYIRREYQIHVPCSFLSKTSSKRKPALLPNPLSTNSSCTQRQGQGKNRQWQTDNHCCETWTKKKIYTSKNPHEGWFFFVLTTEPHLSSNGERGTARHLLFVVVVMT